MSNPPNYLEIYLNKLYKKIKAIQVSHVVTVCVCLSHLVGIMVGGQRCDHVQTLTRKID